MVVFICDTCQESVNRPKVEAHAARCGGHTARLMLSCVDCGKQFRGEEFRAHVKCVSEDEKYQGHLFKKTGKQNKKDTWSDVILELQTSGRLSKEVQSVLDATLARVDASNFPNKRPKFANFFNNGRVGAARYRESIVNEIWEGLMAVKATKLAPSEASTLVSRKNDSETQNEEEEQRPSSPSSPYPSRSSLKRTLKEAFKQVSDANEPLKLSSFAAKHFPDLDKSTIAEMIGEHYGEKYAVRKNEKGKRLIVRMDAR